MRIPKTVENLGFILSLCRIALIIPLCGDQFGATVSDFLF